MLPPPSASDTDYDGWKLLTTHAWNDFHSQWWSASGAAQIRDARETRTLTIRQTDVHIALGVLEDTGGAVYLSDELLRMYQCVSTAFREEEAGVAYTGMPRVGKSYALVYVLLCRMADGLPVLFSASTGKSFFFDEHGVWIAAVGAQCDIFTSAYDDITPSTRPWSLIDHPNSVIQLPSPHLVHTGFLFPVHVTRYEECRYYRWASRVFAAMYHMNPWGPAELSKCLPLQLEYQKLPSSTTANWSTESELAQILALCGPTPSEVLSEISTPGITHRRLQDALKRVRAEQMEQLALHLLTRERPNELSDALLAWERDVQEVHPNYDAAEMRFKSALAHSMASARLREMQILPSHAAHAARAQSLYEIPVVQTPPVSQSPT